MKFSDLQLGAAFKLTLRATADMEPDPVVSAKLEQVSDQFVELKQKALATMKSKQQRPYAEQTIPNPVQLN